MWHFVSSAYAWQWQFMQMNGSFLIVKKSYIYSFSPFYAIIFLVMFSN